MNSNIIIAVLSVIGTLGGSAIGAIASGKLTSYRIQQLEKKVDEHNNYAKRLPVLENTVEDHERRLGKLEK